jgi:hypothetical protein
MPTTIVCFHCRLSAGMDLDQTPMTIGCDHREWERKCAVRDAGGILLCPNMRSILQVLAGSLDGGVDALVDCRHGTDRRG